VSGDLLPPVRVAVRPKSDAKGRPAPAATLRHHALERRTSVQSDRRRQRLLEGGPGAAVQRRAAARLEGREATMPAPRPAARTGLPDRLKAGVEQLSGHSLDDVRVHYNSAKPAALNALAYTQGSDIHLGPGQEKHLAHEAWHVVQQKQGRVKPTLQLKATPVNDDPGLEREADSMGARALTLRRVEAPKLVPLRPKGAAQEVAQRQMVAVWGPPGADVAFNNKMHSVIATVNRMGQHVHPDLLLTIHITQDPNRLQTMPADTNLNRAAGTINMTIRSWYVQMSSIGEILGMIAHELGVHSLAEMEMSLRDRNREQARQALPYARRIAGRNRPLAPLGAPGDRRQADHVNVAKFDLTHHGNLTPTPRMLVYILTMIRTGDAIQAGAEGAAVKRARQQDLFKTFLFDLARLIATDDGTPWAHAVGAGRIAEVFNTLRNYMVDRYAGRHDWLYRLRIDNATFTSLSTMLVKKAATAIWTQKGALARQTGRAAFGLAVGGVSLAGRGIGAVAGGVAAVGGGLLRGARRLLPW